MKKNIVILGGGIGGIATAYFLRKLDKNINITLLSSRPYFGFTPAYPHLALGLRKFEEITIPLDKILNKKSINYVKEDGKIILPEENKVITTGEKEINYDYLVIATGPKLIFEVEGQKENTKSVCTAEHAINLYNSLKEFYKDPGPVVIGAIPGVSCFGPAYEFAFMLHHELKKLEIRRKTSITFITPEPYVGHLGIAGAGASRRLLEELFQERSIKYITNAKIKKVETNKIVYEDLEGKTYEIDAKFSMIMPKFSGTDVVASAGDKLANPNNKMVIVNKCFNNPTYKNIYAVGVVTHIPPVEQTPIPVGTPKTGMMIEQMALAVAHNIINDIKNEKIRYYPILSAICVADMSSDGIGFYVSPVIPPRETVMVNKSIWMHLFKIFFEKYYLWKIKFGDVSPFIEEKMLEILLEVKAIKPCENCEGLPGTP
ncbi:MAG: NAD(P)/FAD-dependent oxidoreductase [bacterium]